MPPQLSAAMRTELRKSNPAAYWVGSFGFPGGTKRYSRSDVSSDSLGLLSGRLNRLGGLPYGIEPDNPRLEAVQVDGVEIQDKDFTLANMIDGSTGNQVRGSTATLQLISPDVAAADWHTRFTGIVAGYRFPRPLFCSLRLRNNDLPLRRFSPLRAINRADFPFAHTDALGTYGPLLYGKHSLAGGAVPCFYVDVVRFRVMVCWGWAKSVDEVFGDGTQYATNLFTIEHPLVSGRRCTVVQFTTNPYHPAPVRVTVNAQGYEAAGDGSGALITNPVTQIRHWLDNFSGYADYMTGAWLTGQAPVNSTHYTAAQTFLSNLGKKGSKRIAGEQRESLAILNDWAKGEHVRLWWTRTGEIAFRFNNPARTDLYQDDPWFRWQNDQIGDAVSIDYPDGNLIDRVSVNYLHSAAEGAYKATLEVRDPSLSHPATLSLDQPWSHAAF